MTAPHSRSFSFLSSLILAVSLFAACDRESQSNQGDGKGSAKGGQASPEQSEAAKQEAEQKQRAELLEKAREKLQQGKDLNEKDYEVIVLSLESCPVDERRGYIENTCDVFETLKTARARRNSTVPDQPEMWRLIADRNLSHPSAPVRIYSAQLLTSAFGVERDMYKRLLEASRQEDSPAVLQAFIRGLRMHVGKDPEIASRLIELSKHEDEHVREAVIVGLTSLWASGSQGTLERALEMVREDPSMTVRKTGCANLGSRADDRALPLLEEYTAWPPVEKELYNDCFRGLVSMWSAPVPHKRPSQKAYELTMARLQETPRSEERPAWMAFSNLAWANKKGLLERAPYIKVEELRKLLEEIISDRQANWLGRNSAITALLQLGATREDLETIKKRAYDAKTIEKGSPDGYVLNKLDKEIERLSK